MKRIVYVTGTRADYGLMKSTLSALDSSEDFSLRIVVTGMHLHPRYGETWQEIQSDGFDIAAKISVGPEEGDAHMATSTGEILLGCAQYFESSRPDLVLLLGDRGEMIAAALAALYQNIPIVHIHGGERSGTVDEPVRHAISKLSHIHLVSTDQSKKRLRKMGESAQAIHVVGAPGLDGLKELVCHTREELLQDMKWPATEPVALLVFHPVVQEATQVGQQMCEILRALQEHALNTIALLPNTDFGESSIRQALYAQKQNKNFKLVSHLPREQFISWMAHADVMIGNSSAGIIEAATFGTPVINIGSRQHLRERNANVTDAEPCQHAISDALRKALSIKRYAQGNVYGDGKTASVIAGILSNIDLEASMLSKVNTY